MKIKTLKIFAILLSLILLLSGCEKNIGDTEKQETVSKTGEITDTEEIEKLWQEYFYDAITTVCNAMDFSSTEEIDPVYVAQFCWYKYTRERAVEDLELLRDGSRLRLFPLEKVLELANQYFNITSLDVSKVSENEYSKEKKAFIFGFPDGASPSSYTSPNPWGIHIDKITRSSDGKITAKLEQYDSYETKRVTINKTLIMKERQDGSMYFTAGKWDYVNNNLVTIKGDVTQYQKIQGFDGSMEELFMIGEIDGRLIMAHTPFTDGRAASLILVNPDGLRIEKTLKLKESLYYSEIRQTKSKLLAYFDDKIMTFSRDLEKLEEIPLPVAIRDKIKQEQKYDSQGMTETFFGGYDVSSDLSKLVYSDEEGVKLYDLTTGSERLLAKTKDAPKGSELIKKYFHSMPRFVSEDKKIITVVYGYECIMNYTLYTLDTKMEKTLDIRSDGHLGVIRYDTGLIGINTIKYIEASQSSEYLTFYLDFKEGNMAEIKLEDIGDTGYIVPDYYRYVGQNFAAFVSSKNDYKDNAKSIYHINHLDLKSMQLKPKLVSISAADPHILGVLEDGRIIFWYSRYPGESGICITN